MQQRLDFNVNDVEFLWEIFGYGVDYGQLLMEQEREGEEWFDAFNCAVIARKTAMPTPLAERRKLHSEAWFNAKKEGLNNFLEIIAKLKTGGEKCVK